MDGAYQFLVAVCDPALRLAIIRVFVPCLRIGTVLACNLGQVRNAGRNFENGIHLLRTLLYVHDLWITVREV
jgi:hypothetical protein